MNEQLIVEEMSCWTRDQPDRSKGDAFSGQSNNFRVKHYLGSIFTILELRWRRSQWRHLLCVITAISENPRIFIFWRLTLRYCRFQVVELDTTSASVRVTNEAFHTTWWSVFIHMGIARVDCSVGVASGECISNIAHLTWNVSNIYFCINIFTHL